MGDYNNKEMETKLPSPVDHSAIMVSLLPMDLSVLELHMPAWITMSSLWWRWRTTQSSTSALALLSSTPAKSLSLHLPCVEGRSTDLLDTRRPIQPRDVVGF